MVQLACARCLLHLLCHCAQTCGGTVAADPLSVCACKRAPGPSASSSRVRRLFNCDGKSSRKPLTIVPASCRSPMSRFSKASASKIAMPGSATALFGGLDRTLTGEVRSGAPLGKHFGKSLQVHWLREIVVHPFANASVPVARHRAGREGDDWNPWMRRLADAAGRFEAVHHRHLAVHQHQIVSAMLHRFDGFGAIGDRVGFVSQLLQLRQSYDAIGGVVLRHQDSRLAPRGGQPPRRNASAHRCARSRDSAQPAPRSASRPARRSKTAVNQKVEPSPSRLSTPIFPPIISTSCLQIASPRPVPPYLRVVEVVRLGERREQCRDLVRPYPDSGIGDGETKGCLAICFAQKLRLERHLAPFGELDGIAGEIGQHLAQAVGIAAQQQRNFRRHSRMELESLGARLDAQKLDHIRDGVAQIEAADSQGRSSPPRSWKGPGCRR